MSDPQTSMVVPLDILQQLAPMAEQMGIDLPGATKLATTIKLTLRIRDLSLAIGRNVARHNIFLKGTSIVTVNPLTGEEREMTARRFCGWVEEHCAFLPGQGSNRIRDSLSVEEASTILEQEVFQTCLRPLVAVHKMILPVVRDDGTWEFLAPGYDEQSQIFTACAIEYEMDWTLDRARDFLDDHCRGYPWNWEGDIEGGDGDLRRNRNYCVHVAAMIGTYCRAMFKPGTPRPMIAYLANQPGTGKSISAAMSLFPVYGTASAQKKPKDDDKLDSELEAAAQHFKPYIFFDDLNQGIYSTQINRFITASSHTGRILGTPRNFDVPQVTQIYVTGNEIKISPDLTRRALIAEMFLAGDVQNRKFNRVISTQYLAKTETRKMFLSAFCAFVKNAMGAIAALKASGAELPELKTLASFEDYTGTVSIITQLAGYGDPIAAPQLSAGGAEEEDEIRDLLVRIATEEEDDCDFDRAMVVDKAREFCLLEQLVGAVGAPPLNPKEMISLGKKLKKWRGRELVDGKGRRFRFSHKRQKMGAKYPLRFLTRLPAPLPD